jgi:diguanylate cyclase (GGDEF)-like protein
MAVSFRTALYLGLIFIITVIFSESLFSFIFVSRSTERINEIINLNESKLSAWYDVAEIIYEAKEDLSQFSQGNIDVIAPMDLMIDKAIKKMQSIKDLVADPEELLRIEEIINECRILQTVVHAYEAEIREGYRGGSSGIEMEAMAVSRLNSIVQLWRNAVTRVNDNLVNKKDEVFRITEFAKRMLGFIFISATLSAIIVGFFIARSLSIPIEKLAKGTQRIANGDLEYKVKIETKDEIGQLADSFNRMAKELAKVQKDLVSANEETMILYIISSKIIRTIDLDELLSVVLETITSMPNFPFLKKGGVFTIEGETMRLAAHLGHSSEFLEAHQKMKVGECLCGQVAKTEEILISNDCFADDGHTILPSDTEPHGHIIVPLKGTNRLVGVLYLYLPVNQEVSDHLKKMFEIIGTQLGIAIENATNYKDAIELTLVDPLTGLQNRRVMLANLDKYIVLAERHNRSLSLIMMDLDHFKKFNDAHGHQVGDQLLVQVAKIMQKLVRKSGHIVRYGGEEFLLMLPEADWKDAFRVAERIRRAVEEETPITISLGVASLHQGEMGVNSQNLIKDADKALYRAKQLGRNRIEIAWKENAGV